MGRDVSTEPGLPSLWNIFKTFFTEQRICPITGMDDHEIHCQVQDIFEIEWELYQSPVLMFTLLVTPLEAEPVIVISKEGLLDPHLHQSASLPRCPDVSLVPWQ